MSACIIRSGITRGTAPGDTIQGVTPDLKLFFCGVIIGGFRDTYYLGRQVVLRPGGPRAGMGSAGVLGALRAPLDFVWGSAPDEIEFAAF